ncbi:MAG: hypothetical protein MHM6MM_003433 [Cercozoa sp. M6MM]
MSGRLRKTLRTLAVSVLSIGAFTAATSFYGMTVVNKKFERNFYDDYKLTPYELHIPYDDVVYLTKEGTTASGWFLKSLLPSGSRSAVVIFVGYGNHRADFLGIAAALWRAGHNVCIFDFLHRSNEPEIPASIGYFETEDARRALRRVRELLPEDSNISLAGASMGGAVALTLFAENPDLLACATDCAFADLHDVVQYRIMRSYGTPKSLAEPAVELIDSFNKWHHGYSLRDVSPEKKLKGACHDRPLMLTHASSDSIVPLQHVHRLFEAADTQHKSVHIDDCEHLGSYFCDRHGYLKRLVKFFDFALDYQPPPLPAVQAGPTVPAAELDVE